MRNQLYRLDGEHSWFIEIELWCKFVYNFWIIRFETEINNFDGVASNIESNIETYFF